ncbi:hypothetical protein ACFX12_009213 [Malus domestica]
MGLLTLLSLPLFLQSYDDQGENKGTGAEENGGGRAAEAAAAMVGLPERIGGLEPKRWRHVFLFFPSNSAVGLFRFSHGPMLLYWL